MAVIKSILTRTEPSTKWQIDEMADGSDGDVLSVVAGDIVFSKNAVYDMMQSPIVGKASTDGIRLEVADPTYGWHDIIGDISIRVAGAGDPTFSIFRDGIRAFEFSATVMKEVYIVYHIPHDYVLGTDIYMHAHWANNAAVPNTGNVVWGFEYSSAKGHQQEAFPASSTVTVTQACNATRYWHHVAETAAVTITGLEPDSVILCRVYRDAASGSDTLTDTAFLLTADIHYQSTSLPTKQKSPDFYT